jgi:hypothetical protein
MNEIKENPVKTHSSDRAHYVSNSELYKVYCDWYKELISARNNNQEEPEMPRYIAESIIKICTRLAYRPNFINYSYREDMIGDAIENCIRTVKNFNPEKSINPFSFITTIAFNAFLRRIKAEQNQTRVKSRLIAELPMDELMDVQEHDEDTLRYHNQFIEFLRENNYIGVSVIPVKSKQKKELYEEIGLEEFTNGWLSENDITIECISTSNSNNESVVDEENDN